MIRRARSVPLLLILVAACSAAPQVSTQVSSSAAPPSITIGGGASVELQLMTELYAQVLESWGYTVERAEPVADAATLMSSLREGDLDLAVSVVGELATAAGADHPADPGDLHTLLAADGLTLLDPSGAERTLGVAMRFEDAEEAGIATISDLLELRDDVVWGLPSDCGAVPYCAAVIEGYGLALDDMTLVEVPMCSRDSGAALNDRIVDATLACTTQPEVERMNLIVLDDDRGALPDGAISAVVRTEWRDGAPAGFEEIIESVSGAIDTGELTSLGVQVTVEGRSVVDVAREWLEDNGLI